MRLNSKAALISAFFVSVSGCVPYSETVGAAAPLGTIWQLETVNDTPARATMTLIFLANGDIRGTLPCNSYNARQSAPLPWFEIQDLTLTRRSCDEIAEENRYVELLNAMDHAEAAGDGLLLSDPDDQSLFFRKVEQDVTG